MTEITKENKQYIIDAINRTIESYTDWLEQDTVIVKKVDGIEVPQQDCYIQSPDGVESLKKRIESNFKDFNICLFDSNDYES